MCFLHLDFKLKNNCTNAVDLLKHYSTKYLFNKISGSGWKFSVAVPAGTFYTRFRCIPSHHNTAYHDVK